MGYVAHPCATGTPSASPTSDHYFLNPGARGFASNDGADGQLSQANPAESGRCHFSVFRADSVSVTSTQFAGGDWRWHLSDQHGACWSRPAAITARRIAARRWPFCKPARHGQRLPEV